MKISYFIEQIDNSKTVKNMIVPELAEEDERGFIHIPKEVAEEVLELLDNYIYHIRNMEVNDQ